MTVDSRGSMEVLGPMKEAASRVAQELISMPGIVELPLKGFPGYVVSRESGNARLMPLGVVKVGEVDFFICQVVEG